MALSRLTQFVFHVVAPVLGDDTDIFHLHQEASNRPSDPWLALLELSKLAIPRPPIGGHRITISWLEGLDSQDCLYQFRLYADELINLATVLDIPPVFRTRTRYAFPRVEALGLLLARFKSAGDIYDMSTKYNRSAAAISELVNELSEFLDDRWQHLLDFDVQGVLSPARMAEYAAAIYDAVAPLDSVWSFIDCTIRGICRPSRYQRQAYNGYKKIHAEKYQALKLPNGLIGHLFGPIEGRRNDNALLADSQLLEKCAQFALKPGADHNTPIDQRYFQIFGDPAYGLTPLLMSPFATADRTPDQRRWNKAMSRVRMSVEHGFGELTREWPFLNAWWKHRVYASPVGRYYRVCVLLTNALNCISPNQTSQAFECLPPTVDEYFHD